MKNIFLYKWIRLVGFFKSLLYTLGNQKYKGHKKLWNWKVLINYGADKTKSTIYNPTPGISMKSMLMEKYAHLRDKRIRKNQTGGTPAKLRKYWILKHQMQKHHFGTFCSLKPLKCARFR